MHTLLRADDKIQLSAVTSLFFLCGTGFAGEIVGITAGREPKGSEMVAG